MKSFFDPAIRLINKLNFPKKLLLLFTIVFVIVLALGYQAVNPLLVTRSISKEELLGLEFIRKLYDIRRMIFQTINYMTIQDPKKIEKYNAEIEQAFLNATQLARKLEPILDVANDMEKIILNWSPNKERPSISAEPTTIAIRNLITKTCDSSYLTVEQDIDASYLTDAICTKFNNYTENVANVRDGGTAAIENKAISEEERDKLTTFNNTAKFYAREIENDVAIAVKVNPSLDATIGKMTREYMNYTNAQDEVFNNVIVKRQLNSNPTQFFEDYSKLIDFSYRYRNSMLDEITKLIKARIKESNQLIVLNVGTILLGTLLFSYLFLGIYFSILRSIKQLVIGSKDISQGKLDSVVKLETKDELLQVGDSFNLMRENLEKLVTNIKSASNSVYRSSEEIALGNSDLAKRTIVQSTSLEETSLSLDKIAKTVQKNSENAKDSYSHADRAASIAAKGSAVINEMVNLMNSVNRSVQQITDIIEVINDVSSQTNILSLNAAVEAARAGEQGRGFAVVATEIRNLSRRSADSARGIKNLISNSVDSIKAGTKLAEDALVTIHELAQSTNIVRTMMSNIADASRDLNASMEQINVAIEELGKVTQQNSTLVEEAAHAAQSLQEEAEHMFSLVNVFKISSATENIIENNNDLSNTDPGPLADRIEKLEEMPELSKKTKKISKDVPLDDEWTEF